MAFKRNIESILIEWKQKKGHNPIVIKGVRQCGKTFSVKAFAEKNYKHVVYLDFHEHKEYKAFFAGALDVDTLLMNIAAAMPDSVFENGQTCLIFDEIQDCPAARASLKFWKLDGRFDVICTGSLLGVNGYKTKEEREEEERTSIPVGYEDIVNMYPMDFEEPSYAERHMWCCERSEKNSRRKTTCVIFLLLDSVFSRNTLWQGKSLKKLMNQTNQTNGKRIASAAPCHIRTS